MRHGAWARGSAIPARESRLRNKLAWIMCAALALTSQIVFAQNPGALEQARAAIRLKEFRHAVAVLEPAARGGSADAQFLLSSLHRAGLGVEIDLNAARALLTDAANQGHAAAAYSLAMMLRQEEPRDEARASEWLQHAAKAGHALAIAARKRGSLPLEFHPQSDLTETSARRAAFWLAVQRDDAALVSALLDPELLHATDDFGRGALAYAAQHGATRVTVLLIEKGAQVDQADSYGVTPLMLAAKSADLAMIDRLLQNRADAKLRDAAGNTALMYAAGRTPPDAALVARLLKDSPVRDAVNTQGWSALDWATVAASDSVAAMLRANGVRSGRPAGVILDAPQVPLRRAADAADLYRGLPDVQVAAARSSTDLLGAVLRLAPDTAVPMDAVHSATVAKSAAALQMMLGQDRVEWDAQKWSAALRWAARYADETVVRVLLRGKPGVQELNLDGESPVIAAVRAHRVDSLRVLLSSGLSANGREKNGMTALMIAAAAAQPEAVVELLQHGANIGSLDNAGRSALWYAAANGSTQITERLAADRGIVDVPDETGQTPLSIAAAHGHARVIEVLLGAGASVAKMSSTGATPLMLAAASGSAETVRALLSGGAALDLQNRHGDTALITAVRQGHGQVVKTLLDAGASDKLRNADRASALDVASGLGLIAIQNILTRG